MPEKICKKSGGRSCGYVWRPKVKNPKSCPHCKGYQIDMTAAAQAKKQQCEGCGAELEGFHVNGVRFCADCLDRGSG